MEEKAIRKSTLSVDKSDKNSFALKGLFILSCLVIIYIAKSILLPLTVSVLFSLMLAPVVRFLKKFWIPSHLSAALIVIIVFFSIGYGFYSLSGPAKQWATQGPQNYNLINQKIQNMLGPLKGSIIGFTRMKEQFTKTTSFPSNNVPEVTVKQSGFLNTMFNSTKEFLFELFMIIFLLYFLLAYDDFFLRKVADFMPGSKGKEGAASINHQIEHEIFVFLLAKLVTGIILGIIIAIIMYFFKMPTPILWGILAGLFEFIPYIGVTIGTVLVGITALISFDNALIIVLVPVIFFAVTSLNGNFIFPLIIGRNLEIHPVIVFIGVIFWGWIWGITGALIAIPLLSVIKIICNNVNSLQRFSKFLGL